MEENQILKAVADTLTDTPLYEMVVPVNWLPKQSIWARMRNVPVEKYRTLVFYPAVVANQYRIAGEAALLPEDIYEDNSLNISFIPEHQKRIVYIIASALQNNHLEPAKELILFIERNFNGQQLRDALIASFQSLNMEAFTDTIVLMKGTVSILKASPADGSELIASHTE